jgi:3-phenylpropionate/cinnamic acid dioxygenase small subunit
MSKQITPEAGEEVSPELFTRVTQFYNHEAELLNQRDFGDWMDIITEDIQYVIPVRVSREAGDDTDEFSAQSQHLNENFEELQERVPRFDKEYAWSENPASRIRRFVTNIMPERTDDGIEGTINVLLYRSRRDKDEADILTAVREETLIEVDGQLRIDDRTVYLDNTKIPTKNFAFFI